MAITPKPDMRPANPNFSSGPCAKRPGFTLDALSGALLGRNHRAREPKARLAEVIDRSRAHPRHAGRLAAGHRPRLRYRRGGDRAVVAAWRPRPVDILTFESFGEGWATDCVKQLKLQDARVLSAPIRRSARSRRGRSGA